MPESSPPTGLAASGPVSFVIFALARTHRALAAGLLREIGLYTGQEIMLMQIWENDGLSLNDLAQALRLDHSTVTKSVKRLVDSGFVDQQRSTADRRVAVVTLTAAGRALIPRIVEVWREIERRTTAGLSRDRLAALVRTASEIESTLAAESDRPTP